VIPEVIPGVIPEVIPGVIPEVDVEERPPSIGEEVDALSQPDPETEEAQVQAALDIVNSALVADSPDETDADEEEAAEEEQEAKIEEAQFQEAAKLEEETELEDERADDLDEAETEGEEEDDEWDQEATFEEDDSADGASESGRVSAPTIAQPYLFPVHRREADEPEDDGAEEAPEDDSETAADGEQPELDGSETDGKATSQAENKTAASSNFDWRGRPVD